MRTLSYESTGGDVVRVVVVRLFRVEGEGPAWTFEDRSVEALDRYPDHVRATAGAGDSPTHLGASYVEIDTDEGVSGLYGPIDARQAFLIATDLRPLLLGADPLATEQLHDRMLRLHRHGRAGLFVNAVSAVDNALWDLRGKAAGQPVYRLLGGPTRDRVPVYASMLGHSVEPDRAAVVAAEHRRLGFGAQKWFFAHGPGAGWQGLQRNLAMARAVREAVGDGYPLMFDAFMGWDATYAADMLRGLEPLEPYWMEEPVPPERLGVFRRLASETTIRLATGEHAHTRWQVKELLDAGVRVIQADPDWAGGITEQRHICSLCSAYDVPVVAHGHAVAVPLHVAASQSPQVVPMVEYLVRVQERNQFFHRTILRPVDGALELPTDPGLGIVLDPSKVERRSELAIGG
ncbi:MAG: enolase C-terminal domain-like protein [Actinomycetota bacterium]